MSGARGLRIAGVAALLIAIALAVSASAAPPPAVPATEPAARPAAAPATRAATAPATAPASMPAIRVGYDTTRITKPLKPDGTVDYIAAINEMYSKGVTKDNNALVPILQILGPDLIPGDVRERVLALLDVKVDYDQQFLNTNAISRVLLDAAAQGPWAAKDIPEVADWLRGIKSSLTLAEQACKRPGYYYPAVRPNANDSMFGVLVPTLKSYQTLALAFKMRANLAISEDRLDDAWNDLLCVYRFSNLFARDWPLITRLIAIRLSTAADTGTQDLAKSSGLTSKRAQAIINELSAMGQTPEVVESIDVGQRFCLLDLAQSPPAFWADLFYIMLDQPERKKTVLLTAALMAVADKIDRNAVLMEVNKSFDLLVQGYGEPDLKKRAALLESFDKRIEAVKAKSAAAADAFGNSQQATAWATSFFCSTFMPTLHRSQALADKAQVTRQLTLLSLALAAYHADDGKYPVKLADLSPKYIKAVPTDFFAGGKDFVYKITRRGYVLYSVGENGKDDGGKDAASGVAGPDDIVVRVGDDDPQRATKEGSK